MLVFGMVNESNSNNNTKKTSWWQLKIFFYVHPEPWGFMIPNLTEAYVSQRVGSSKNHPTFRKAIRSAGSIGRASGLA